MAKPWTTGPNELLQHAAEHIRSGTPFDYRIAFISVDNAVELSIKTYLGLPKRIRGTDGPSRKNLSDASSSFPDLLDLLEQYAADRLSEVELGDIEWYHRTRNTLYHEGNGVTVDKDQVDAYLQVARVLFKNLFEESSALEQPEPISEVGDLILIAASVERALKQLYLRHHPDEKEAPKTAAEALSRLVEKGVLPRETASQLLEAGRLRNAVAHSAGNIDRDAARSAAGLMRQIFESLPKE